MKQMGWVSLQVVFVFFVLVTYTYIFGRHYGRAYDGATRVYDGVYGWVEGCALAGSGYG